MKKSYKLRVPDDIASMVRTMHPTLKKKVKVSLQEIISDPAAGKALRDDLEGLRSYRVSKFRIIYRIAKKREIELISIGPRKYIYEETYRILKREERTGKR
jgi:mRNA interferase RelE/StbE